MPARTPILRPAERAFVERARRAVLTTIGPDGAPRPVPICFVLDPSHPVLYTPLDEKPKAVEDVRALARARNIAADPRVSVLVDRWDEDWTRLAWVRLDGSAALLEPDEPAHPLALAALRRKYDQYRAHRLEALPVVTVRIDRATAWGDLEG